VKNIKNLLAALMLASTAFGSLSVAAAPTKGEQDARVRTSYAQQMAEIKRQHDERLAMNTEEQQQRAAEAQAEAATEEHGVI